MSKSQRYRPSPVRFFLPGAGMTHQIVEDIAPKRVVFYSSVLALSSAALAFLGQGEFHKDSTKIEALMVVSIISFGLSICTLLILYFFHIIHALHWSRVDYFDKKMNALEPLQDFHNAVEHAYFKNNDEELKRFKDSISISARLMGIEVKLDLLLLVFTFLGVASYCANLLLF